MHRIASPTLLLLALLPAIARSQAPTAGATSVERANALLERHAAEKSLQQKLVALGELQSEVDTLRQKLGLGQQIAVHVQVVRVSITKLRELGFKVQDSNDVLSILFGIATQEIPTELGYGRLILNPKKVTDTIREFQRKQALAVIAEPTLITTNKRPAHFFCGGSIPGVKLALKKGNGLVAETPARKFGTEVDVLPTLVASNKVYLDVRPHISERDDDLGSSIDGVATPGLRVVEIDAGVEMDLGMTLVIGGMRQTRVQRNTDAKTNKKVDTVQETATYFLVTPELVVTSNVATGPLPAVR